MPSGTIRGGSTASTTRGSIASPIILPKKVIRITVLCPGLVQTAILEGGGKYGKMLVAIPPEIQKSMWKKYKPTKADLFAEKALSAVAKNEAIVIIPVESRKIIGLSMRRKCRWFCRVMIKTR